VAILYKRLRSLHRAAAAHHATLLFGSFFSLRCRWLGLVFWTGRTAERISTPAFVTRTISIVVVVGAAIAVVLLPFWIALINNPVTQVPISHGSRANYILSPWLGLNYFVIPYGALIFVLPFIVLARLGGGSAPSLAPGLLVAFLVGIGGTTPVGHLLLGRAYEVLTMERFSYWATLLALPFVGLLATELVDRFRIRAVDRSDPGCGLHLRPGAAWIIYRPADADEFKVDSAAAWLGRDGHDKYRYVTLVLVTESPSWPPSRMLTASTAYGTPGVRFRS